MSCVCIYAAHLTGRDGPPSLPRAARSRPVQWDVSRSPRRALVITKGGWGGVHGALIRFGDDGPGDACRPRLLVCEWASLNPVSLSHRGSSSHRGHWAPHCGTQQSLPPLILSASRANTSHVFMHTPALWRLSASLHKEPFHRLIRFLLSSCRLLRGTGRLCSVLIGSCVTIWAVEESWCKSYWTWHKSCWGAGGEAANMLILICSGDLDPELHLLMHIHSRDDIGSFTEPKEIHLKLWKYLYCLTLLFCTISIIAVLLQQNVGEPYYL